MPTRRKATQTLQKKALNRLYQQNMPMGDRSLYYAKNLLMEGQLIDVIFAEEPSDHIFSSSPFDTDQILHSLGLSEYTEDIYDQEDRIEAVVELFSNGDNSKKIHKRPTHHKNLKALGAQFGLDKVSLTIIEFLIEHSVEKGLRAITEGLGEINRQQVAQLISVAIGTEFTSVVHALRPHSKLMNSGLVITERSIMRTEDTFSERVRLLHGLAEQIYTGEDLMTIMQHMLHKSPSPKLEEKHFHHLGSLHQDLERLCSGSSPRNILLYGEPGVGKSELVRSLSASMGKSLYEVTSVDEDNDPIQGRQRLSAYQVCQNLLKHPNDLNMLCFDEAEDLFPSEMPMLFLGRGSAYQHSTGKAHLNRVLEQTSVTTVWISNQVDQIDPAYLRRFDLVAEVKGPTTQAREGIIRNLTAHLPLSNEWIEQVARHQKLQPGHIEQAAKSVSDMMKSFQGRKQQRTAENERLMNFFLMGTQKAIGNNLSQPKKNGGSGPKYDLNHLNTETDIHQMVQGLKRSHEGRIALYGPPGTGKSALGKYIAQQLDRPLMQHKASDLIDKYVGESEKNIAEMFEKARDEGAVLLLDEGDSFLRSREGAHNSWEVTQVNELLTQLEEFEGVFILSTNLMEQLDSAALRRFDIKIHLDYMNPEQRWKLFNQVSRELKLKRKLSRETKQSIENLDLLTPGDFQAVMRKNRVLQSFEEIQDLASALKEECMVKPGAQRNPIGFV